MIDVVRVSRFTGKTHIRSIDVTLEQLQRIQNGELVQNVLPHLCADDREFIISGITPEEWDAAFGDDD